MQDSGSEDSTSITPAEIVAPKPPPRVRTPEEVAAGLERQKAAVDAIRNTPEKRAATRAAAPIEIPSTTIAAGVSTAPVDTSGTNRPLAPASSGGKLKGMFKGKVPSVPGFKSKRATAVAGEGAVVSSAPVEVAPDTTSLPATDDSQGSGRATASTSNPAAAPERSKSGGRFSGMFKRNSGKAKKSKGKASPGVTNDVPDEVELTDQVDNVHLSEEPVLAGEPTRQYPEVVHQVPAQQFPPSAPSSGNQAPCTAKNFCNLYALLGLLQQMQVCPKPLQDQVWSQIQIIRPSGSTEQLFASEAVQ